MKKLIASILLILASLMPVIFWFIYNWLSKLYPTDGLDMACFISCFCGMVFLMATAFNLIDNG